LGDLLAFLLLLASYLHTCTINLKRKT